MAGGTREAGREAPEGLLPTQGHGDSPHTPTRPEGLCRETRHSRPYLVHSAGADVGGVHPRPRDPLVELEHLRGQRRCRCTPAQPCGQHRAPNLPPCQSPGMAVLPFTFSLSSNIQKKGVMAPMSSACVVTAMMWFSSRVISAKRTGGRGSTGGKDPQLLWGRGTGSEPPKSRELRALSSRGRELEPPRKQYRDMCGRPHLGSTEPAEAGGC